MKVYRDLEHITISRPVATIGIFDGVHIAHQAIIRKLIETAQSIKGESTIVTLWPHPRIVLDKDADSLKLLSTLEEKIKLLERAGIDNLVVISFDRKFAETGFDKFIRDVLVEKLRIAHLVVGFNHQFGKNREGKFQNLQDLARELGFRLSQQEPISLGKEKVSSSAIRTLLQRGVIEKANQYLGYNYNITGTVVKGNQKGREIGFPTANIVVGDSYKMIPCDGVYAVCVRMNSEVFDGMMNIGCRPTLSGDCQESILEVNLFNFEKDIYGKELQVEFIDRLREEKKFNSFAELKIQILKDKENTIEIISRKKSERN